MSKILKVTVSPKGETKLETVGFSGNSCQEASRNFERALGVSTGEQLTGEYYTTAAEQQIEAQN